MSPGASATWLLTVTALAVGEEWANSRYAGDAIWRDDVNRPSLRFGLVWARYVARGAQGDRSPSGRREISDRSSTPERLPSPHCWASQPWHPQSRRKERDHRLEEPRWRRMFGGATPTVLRWRVGLAIARARDKPIFRRLLAFPPVTPLPCSATQGALGVLRQGPVERPRGAVSRGCRRKPKWYRHISAEGVYVYPACRDGPRPHASGRRRGHGAAINAVLSRKTGWVERAFLSRKLVRRRT
jgi:hypothetical protein